MKPSYVIVTCLLVLTVAIGLCVNGCGKREVQTTEEVAPPVPPAAPTTEQPAAEQPSAGGVGEKLGKILASVTPPTSYEMKVIAPSGQQRGPGTMLMKMAERKPMKTKMVGDRRWTLLDYEQKMMYMYDKDQNVVMKRSLEEGGARGPRALARDVDLEAEVVGAEKVDGVDCWIISSTVEGETTKMWVGKQDGLTRQMEAAEGVTKFEYSRINQVPDSEFELPAGVKVVDMPERGDMPRRPRGR